MGMEMGMGREMELEMGMRMKRYAGCDVYRMESILLKYVHGLVDRLADGPTGWLGHEDGRRICFCWIEIKEEKKGSNLF